VNAAELREQTTARDARSVGNFEVRFTDAAAYLQTLEQDAQLGAIADSIVWLARTAGIATLDEVTGRWNPGGGREVESWRSMYVECSYIARGQLHKLSVYCGVARKDAQPGGDDRSEATALRLLETERRMQTAVSKLRGEYALQVRGGGALHLHDLSSPWMAHPDQSIEAVPEPVCATCKEPIHYANETWRHDSDNRAEATLAAEGWEGNPIRKLHHVASPEHACGPLCPDHGDVRDTSLAVQP